MPDDAYYRQVLAQMQDEFQRALQALEKQVAALTRHNELLSAELAQSHKQQRGAETQAKDATLELAALKRLLQQEQDYWARHDQAGRGDRDRLTQQLAQAQADAMQRREQNRALRNEMRALQSRVDTAVATSRSFEQRLLLVVQEKQQSAQEMETQLTHYKKKLSDKRAQNKVLTQALVRLQEQRHKAADSSSYGSPVSSRPVTTATAAATEVKDTTMTSPVMSVESVSSKSVETQQRRVRKREMGLTLPDEIKAAAASVTTSSRMYKSKRMGSSRAGTSPTSSSPEISPRSARAAPYKRAPSVATTTPTASDGNSFNSNSSSGSLRSMRSLRHVTGRRINSRNSSDSDNIDVSPRTSAGHVRATPTGRLERELSGLRRKLDSCMADAAARW
ncbi:hypothetical protein PF005_g20439 [Phytophthora fragariae]|uniref:Uncharacterized protein n=2 Tax=Phytophthora fragariae TaxID=53985 RepID=A0A6A3XFT8_9STRA|nr:hypothetical protein PF003_g24683 [Phytophthora fragariae]KAE8928375.1 hypothetical protein PF009_g21482 [Phytophthora fragariae]KAE8988359.1 hypothetical protein PF011_g19203 [Phytophthora fragariae]KAE9079836.1 hypothetical protein PF007_g23292 [Phytophthora fragariae]KAE9087215.1 hypothetical protein PF010_g19809 [Phytophthora fragariae]